MESCKEQMIYDPMVEILLFWFSHRNACNDNKNNNYNKHQNNHNNYKNKMLYFSQPIHIVDVILLAKIM